MPRATGADAHTAMRKRIAASEPMSQAKAQPIAAAPASAVPMVTTRSLPNLSPSGPCTRTEPAYARANEVTMIEAAETLVAKSAASCGSIGSTQRSEIPALKAASARSTIASREEASLGRKPLDFPAGALPAVKQAVVQPVGASLPEFDRLRHHTVATPVWRPRRRIAIAAARFLHGELQGSPIGNALALRRRPGGKARAERPRGEIAVRVLSAHFLGAPFDAHLALEVRPHEYQAGFPPMGEFARFAARIIRIEDEAALLDAFEKHHPGRRRAGAIHGGEVHRIGQGQARTQRVLEPQLELPDRIALRIGLRKAGAHVLLAQIGDVHVRILPSGNANEFTRAARFRSIETRLAREPKYNVEEKEPRFRCESI